MNNIITEDQHRMINMIIEGVPLTKIAKELNKSRSTLYNWLTLDSINNEIEGRKAQLRREAKAMMTYNVNVFVKNIMDLANNSNDARVKLQANKYLLDQIIGAPATSNENRKVDNKNVQSNPVDLKKELEALKKIQVVK